MIAKTERDAMRQAAIIERRRAFIERWAQPKIKRAYAAMAEVMIEQYGIAGIDRIQNNKDEVAAPMAKALGEVFKRVNDTMRVMAKTSGKAFGGVVERKAEEEDLGVIWEELQRAFLAEAFKQSKTIAETFIDDIVTEILSEVAENPDPQSIYKAMRSRAKDLAPWKASMVARTEAGAAMSEAQDGYTKGLWDEVEDGPLYKKWHSVRSSRTRDDHRRMNGEVVPYDSLFDVGSGKHQSYMRYPQDRRGHKAQVINCLLPDSEVSFVHPKAIARGRYTGEVFDIKLVSGQQISVTAYHPILTNTGWKSACLIKEGDDLLVDERGELGALHGIKLNKETVNTKVSELFDSFIDAGNAPRIASGGVKFHGDVLNSDVEIVDIGGPLMNGVQTKGLATFEDIYLKFSETARRLLVSDCAVDQFTFSTLFPSDSIVGSFGHFLDVVRRSSFESDQISFGTAANIAPTVFQAAHDSGAGNADFLANLQDRYPSIKKLIDFGAIDFDCSTVLEAEGVKVSSYGVFINLKEFSDFRSAHPLLGELFDCFASLRYAAKLLSRRSVSVVVSRHYDGMVYNIEDYKGLYAAAGIINHNCRCSFSSIPEELVSPSDRRN